tara:strand:- start:13970 stop:15217 length:1248 start_codon:yes stop_codon:yes gene_type:complete
MRYIGILIFSLFFLSLTGQDVDTNSVEYKKLLAMKSSRPVFGISYEIGAANDKISYKSLRDFNNKDFLNDEFKEGIMAELGDGLRFGYWQSINLSWDKPDYWVLGKYISGRKISIENKFITSALASEDAVGLGLFGNRRYLDEVADISNSQYESWWYTSLKYEKRFKIDSSYFSANFNLVIGHDFEQYKIYTGKIYTPENAEYIDAELDYEINNFKDENSIPLRGLGISTGLSFKRDLSSKYWIEAEINDFGLMYWSNLDQVAVDSTFRFKGLTFDNIFEINDSINKSQRDQLSDGFYKEENARILSLMPFQLKLQLAYKFEQSHLKQIYLSSDYLYLPSYSIRYEIGSKWKFREKDQLDIGLRYGGFNTWVLPFNYGLQIRKLRISLGSNNLLAFGLASYTTGASAFIGLHYTL